jgi:hypothetical protein
MTLELETFIAFEASMERITPSRKGDGLILYICGPEAQALDPDISYPPQPEVVYKYILAMEF